MRSHSLDVPGTANGAKTIRRTGLGVLSTRYGYAGIQRRCVYLPLLFPAFVMLEFVLHCCALPFCLVSITTLHIT